MHSNKKIFGRSRSGSSTILWNKNENRDVQYRNDPECSSRGISQVGNPERVKSSRLAFFSTGRKATHVGSSGTSSRSWNRQKFQQERQLTSVLPGRAAMGQASREKQIVDLEPCTRQKGIANLEQEPAPESIHIVSTVGEIPQSSMQGFSLSANETTGNCPMASSTNAPRPRHLGVDFNNQGSVSSFSAQHLIVSNTVNHNPKHEQNQAPRARRYGFGHLSCTSISDVLPSGCSSVIGSNGRSDALRKVCNEGGSSSRNNGTERVLTGRNTGSGESSSARSKSTIRSLIEVDQDSHGNSPSIASSCVLEHPLPQPISRSARRTRNRLPGRDSLHETSGFPPSSVAQFSLNEAAGTPSQFSACAPSITQASSRQSGSAYGSSHTRGNAESEDSNRGFCRPWMHRSDYPRINMEGIAEVLLALERIEQDEVLTYEELMVLESNLFFNAVSFRDQHRDMRMDIDNMSYEELLALEERMGTVSTALTEEALSTCMKRGLYSPVLQQGIANDDDIKCSICQEEYHVGDEVGNLRCDHYYHVNCIQQWLRQKNWCPICKSAASPS